MALMRLARDTGMKVERRPIHIDELDTLKEVAAIGTAVVVNPIASITLGDRKYEYGKPNTINKLKEKARLL